MKLFFIISLLAIAPILKKENISLSGDIENPDKWELVKNSDDVITYMRWVETEKGNKTRERKGEMTIDCTMEEIISILSDTKSSAVWMKNIAETYDLKKVNNTEWYTYTVFNIPWPFNDRDLVSNMKLKSTPETGISTIQIVSREDYIPAKSKTIRLKNYTANWTLKNVDKKKIKITFRAITDEPPMFPRWMQDPVVENMFHTNLVNLKSYISSRGKT